MKTLRALCDIAAVSSCEAELREYIAAEAGPHADQMETDSMGNLIVFKKGKKSTGNRLMLAAHMDEVGLIIRAITEDGYLKFLPVGGIDRRVLVGKKVRVGAAQLPGIIGLKAYHLVSREEEKRIPKLKEFYIDIGAGSREEAEKMVTLGEVAAFEREFLEFGNGLIRTPALDDRIGCAVMLTLLKEALPLDCNFVFTVQEEVGTRGAFGAAFRLKPEIALVLEGTTAADLPDLEAHRRVCAPGRGPVIPFMDGATVYDRGLFELLRGLAEQNGVPWQTKEYIAGGTDAGTIQRSREGVRVAGLSAAVRYLHAPSSVAAVADYEALIALTRHVLDALAEREEGGAKWTI